MPDPSVHATSITQVRASMRAALTRAIKSRDRLATRALRSGLAAIDNAEAVPIETATSVETQSTQTGPIAGAALGPGASEVARRELAFDEVLALLRAEVEERREAATIAARAGRSDRADELRREAEVLAAVLDSPHD